MDLNKLEESEIPAELLASKPVAPLPSDCCGGGCNPCVNDIYEQELRIWKKECLMKIREFINPEEDDYKGDIVISQDSYREFVLVKITRINHNTNVYRFALPGNQKLNLRTGEHLIVRCYSDENSPITRQYTPISPLDACGYFDVLIKLYEHGKMSQCIAKWKEGERKDWRGPFGNFEYAPNRYRGILMFAAGTGITPMAQIIRTVLSNENDYTLMKLLYSCRTYNEILLKDSLDEWKSYWNFTVHYYLSRESDRSNKKYGEEIHYERINRENLSEELKSQFHRRQTGHYTKNILVVVCGPRSFNDDVQQYLLENGVEQDNCVVF